MASREQHQSFTEELICPICLDFFTDPVLLECGHNFCRSCITQCWDKKETNSCPECREEFPEINLRASRALANLAEKAREVKLNPKQKESKLHCEEHQEELKLFCETDKKLICLVCRDAREHREHRFMPIKEAVGIYKDQLKSSLDSLTEKKSAALEMELKQKQQISGVREQSSSLQTHITSEFTKMHQIVTEKEQCLIRDLREQEGKIVETMEKNLREIQEHLNSIQEELSKLQKQMEQKDGVIFLKEEACRKRRISEAYPVLSVADGALSVGKFNGPLQYTAWREMIDAINPENEMLRNEIGQEKLKAEREYENLRKEIAKAKEAGKSECEKLQQKFETERNILKAENEKLQIEIGQEKLKMEGEYENLRKEIAKAKEAGKSECEKLRKKFETERNGLKTENVKLRIEIGQEKLKMEGEYENLRKEIAKVKEVRKSECEKLRQKFVSVTLDVETAHRWLEVSEDLKSVRLTGTWRNLPDTEKRFTARLCVLGSEGFTSGRHYWEVEVEGNRWWSLGVAAESVGRKGGVTLRPENGLWTIGRYFDQFKVNSSPPSPLPAGQIPEKVGVYLSYESGTVLFYSADTKSHLHTFTGNKFTEKLYPFFWTGDVNKWLRICSGSDPGL
uniref:E3 ubiquitin-protein ligase TRIM39-like isoform X2 n=1 Tax=Pristiophorus japonicus TaxID=55135 RepID=UPI00398EE99F